MQPPKKHVKEGTKSEKLINEENIKTLRFYRYIISVCYVAYFAVTVFVFWSSYTKLYISLSLTCFVTCLSVYKFMSYMATPSFGVNDRGYNQLMDAGLDLNIPGRLIQMLWVNILSPWIFDPNQETAVNEKKQKKMERKMKRVGHLMHSNERSVGRS